MVGVLKFYKIQTRAKPAHIHGDFRIACSIQVLCPDQLADRIVDTDILKVYRWPVVMNQE